MVIVNIWWPTLSGNIGHGSMFVGDTYMSNWPGETSAVFLGRGWTRAYEDDKKDEGDPPDSIFYIGGLDEQAMLQWWEGFRRNPRYSLFFLNCMQTVGTGLCIGSPNPLHTRFFAWKYCTHHIALWNFANGLAVSPWLAGTVI